MAKKRGYVEYRLGDEITEGGKYYYNNRGKELILFKIGEEPLEKGAYIMAAHVDSPRIDLKQNPLYEDSGMAFLKTHYYGGIRKYQWVATPLALHGVVIKADGESVWVSIGEDPADPVLYINDLLPHLGHNDDRKPLGEAIPGEKLNLLVGSRPLVNEADGIKLNVLRILNEKYGICEEDFSPQSFPQFPSETHVTSDLTAP